MEQVLPETVQCQEHSKTMYLRQGQYGPFYSHKNMDGSYCNMKAKDAVSGDPAWVAEKSDALKAHQAKTAPQVTREPVQDSPDWDAIAEGKIRHGVAIAFIGQGKELSELTKADMEQWVVWIKEGK